MHGIGHDAGLRPGERDGVVAQIVDGHGQQRRRDALAGGEEHIHLPRRRVLGDLFGHLYELVGGVAPGGHHRNHRVPGLARLDDAVGHPFDAGGIGNGATAELHHHDVRAFGLALRAADDDVLLVRGLFLFRHLAKLR